MKGLRQLAVAGAVSAAVLAPVPALAQSKIVKIDGSSTVYPISEAVAEEFQKAKKGAVRVTVGISGTGGGFKKFCRGESDISDASRPILEKEMKACAEAGIRYVELPVAFDSGTFDYFTDAINGKEKASRGDFTASEDDNVLVQGVSRDVNAVGYFGMAYYVENKDKLKAVPIVSKGSSKGVLPSLETVMDGSYQPLARPIFIYVSEKAMGRPEVKELVEFYLKNAPKLTREVGYVPLSQQHYSMALKNFASKKLGTGFGGKPEVGVKVEELLARAPKL